MVATTFTRRPDAHRRLGAGIRPGRILAGSVVTLLFFLMSAFSSPPGGGDLLLLTHPDSSWSLHLDLAGFQVNGPWLYRNGRQVWAKASSEETGVILTAFVEKVPKARHASDCRDQYLKKVKGARRRMSLSARGEMALAESSSTEEPFEQGQQKHLRAYLHRDGFCMDVHLSKQPFLRDDQKLFWTVLDGLAIVPAAEAERARASAYPLSSGPGDQVLLEAAQKLRAGDFAAADGLLSVLCPDTMRRSRESTASPNCSLRIAGIAEARKISQGKDLALQYWRAGDLLAKDGRPDAALETYRKSLDIRPDDPDTWYSIGHVLRETHDLEAAGAAFARALELRPNDATAMYWLATNLMDQGRLADAEAMLEQVLQADPKEVRVWYRRGEIQMKRGDYTRAIESFEKAQELGVVAAKIRAKVKECRRALDRQDG
jgi:predicted negative regulator of RcsB-dependent stress response